MEFSEREKLVLNAIVDYYLNSGDTIGSRTLVKKYGIDLSSATIRNVMADLEDMGYISKTHTSSGRVPTGKGYKYYLETLLEIKKLSEEEIKKIDIAYERRMNELQEVLSKTSELLSKLTSYAGVVIEPDVKSEKLKKIELVYINEYILMAVIVTENSNIKTKKIHLDNSITEKETKEIVEYLNKKLKNQEINTIYIKIDSIIRKLRVNQEELEAYEEVMKDCFEGMEASFYIEGTPNIIKNIKTENPADIMEMVNFFEDKKDIKAIFENILNSRELKDGKVNIVLGEELNIKGAEDLSFIFSTYNVGSARGIIGVIGPKRMEYSKTAGFVEYVTNEVNKAINNINKKNE